jgi:RND family efflux transporter MFP subunit
MMAMTRREPRVGVTRRRCRALAGLGVLAIAGAIAACGEQAAPPAPVRPVRTVVIEPEASSNTFTAPGEIRARYETPIAFRINGKMIARKVDVGTVVKQGDQIAVLDDRDEKNALDAAKSDVFSAQSQLTQVRAQETRMRELLKGGYVSQSRYDLSLRELQTAEAKLQSANASLRTATDQLSYTSLTAPRDGVITTTGADAGQVVGAGQMVAQLADPSEREGLFNVAESWLRGPRRKDPVVTVSLLGDPTIKTVGRVREISPTADPVTRTYAVRVSLPEAPPQMLLGASVNGQVTIEHAGAVAVLPVAALFQKDAKPAVWVVDKASSTVQLKSVTVGDFETDTVVVTGGLDKGDVVVTAGVQKLTPGQKVRLDQGS